MLFDLRGRGRRRTVKIVYVTLAFLMGGGLVLFGIGGGGAVSGGLVDAITGSSGGGDTGTERFVKNERAAAVAHRGERPQDAAAWAALARARVQTAGVGENFDPGTSTYTEAGKAKLTSAAEAWDKYLALEPDEARRPRRQPDGPRVRPDRAQPPRGRGQGPGDHHRGAPEVGHLRQRSPIYAYLAGQTRKGDLARQAGPRPAPSPTRRTRSRAQLDQAKQQSARQPAQQDAQSATPTPTPKKKK